MIRLTHLHQICLLSVTWLFLYRICHLTVVKERSSVQHSAAAERYGASPTAFSKCLKRLSRSFSPIFCSACALNLSFRTLQSLYVHTLMCIPLFLCHSVALHWFVWMECWLVMFCINRHSEFDVSGVKHIRLLFYIQGAHHKGTVHVEAKQVATSRTSALLWII